MTETMTGGRLDVDPGMVGGAAALLRGLGAAGPAPGASALAEAAGAASAAAPAVAGIGRFAAAAAAALTAQVDRSGQLASYAGAAGDALESTVRAIGAQEDALGGGLARLAGGLRDGDPR